MPASHTQQAYREDIIISGNSRFLGGNLKEVTSSSKTYNSQSQIYSKVEVKGQSGFVGGNYEAKGSQGYKKGVIADDYSTVVGGNVGSGASAEDLDQVLGKRDFSNKTANEGKGEPH
jgi:hypothetical protein